VGRRLKAYRLGLGLTADALAERLGISRAAVYRIESGTVVKVETLERLTAVLGTSMASLLGAGSNITRTRSAISSGCARSRSSPTR
jgi:transcriptional regulator with XRE-family HTH domain